MVDPSVFEDVADAVRLLEPEGFGKMRCSSHRFGVKVWFLQDKPPREHYEAQVIGPEHAPGATTLAVEVGFHSEHPKEADNQAVIASLLESEGQWRQVLGDEAVVGAFLGHAEHWRRVSEVWPDPNFANHELVFELAARITDYVSALEPSRLRPQSVAQSRLYQ